ncbi:hypothetical protein QTO34_008334 [Cnephaeus nilssonii]|uniref:Beta-casein n=1 Tax=Cnephaeus nilssonii TaxID=3371016 RepID=A0AA40LW87_CNENI|nr:hypothetical protein QTO34_008334 [Eptesicus nilssonii]
MKLFSHSQDLRAMKVLILACLVAFAFAKEKEQISVSRETIESISSSEQKPEKLENYKQQQKENERQDKIHPFVQPQPLFYPNAEPIPYAILPQNILPLAQPAMVMPFLQPEVMEVPNTKETIIPKRNVMQLPKSPVVPFLQRQIPNLTDLKAQLPLPLLQPSCTRSLSLCFRLPCFLLSPWSPFLSPKSCLFPSKC